MVSENKKHSQPNLFFYF